MSELKAFIFDVDGTLADTERDGHRVAFNRAFADAGLNWNWTVEIYGDLLSVTGGKERMLYFLEKYDVAPPPTGDLQAYVADLHKAKTTHYTELLSTGKIPLRSGVEALLHEAMANGLRLAIATTTTPENVTALLENTLGKASLGWFEVIAAGDIVPKKKPASDIYDWTLEKMSLNPAEAVAFEDSDNGLKSANSAGITNTVITVNGYTKDHDFTGAGVVLDQLGSENSPATRLQGAKLMNNHVTVKQVRQWFE